MQQGHEPASSRRACPRLPILPAQPGRRGPERSSLPPSVSPSLAAGRRVRPKAQSSTAGSEVDRRPVATTNLPRVCNPPESTVDITSSLHGPTDKAPDYGSGDWEFESPWRYIFIVAVRPNLPGGTRFLHAALAFGLKAPDHGSGDWEFESPWRYTFICSARLLGVWVSRRLVLFCTAPGCLVRLRRLRLYRQKQGEGCRRQGPPSTRRRRRTQLPLIDEAAPAGEAAVAALHAEEVDLHLPAITVGPARSTTEESVLRELMEKQAGSAQRCGCSGSVEPVWLETSSVRHHSLCK